MHLRIDYAFYCTQGRYASCTLDNYLRILNRPLLYTNCTVDIVVLLPPMSSGMQARIAAYVRTRRRSSSHREDADEIIDHPDNNDDVVSHNGLDGADAPQEADAQSLIIHDLDDAGDGRQNGEGEEVGEEVMEFPVEPMAPVEPVEEPEPAVQLVVVQAAPHGQQQHGGPHGAFFYLQLNNYVDAKTKYLMIQVSSRVWNSASGP